MDGLTRTDRHAHNKGYKPTTYQICVNHRVKLKD